MLGFVAAAWGSAAATAPLLQVRRMRRTGSSADVSIAHLAIWEIGFCLWLAYGIALANPAIIAPNVTAAVCGLITIVVAWRLRRSL